MDTLPNELTSLIYSYVNPPKINIRITKALERFKLQVKHLFREKIENCFEDNTDYILSGDYINDYVFGIPNELDRENTFYELCSDLGLNTDDNDFEECCEYDSRVMRGVLKLLDDRLTTETIHLHMEELVESVYGGRIAWLDLPYAYIQNDYFGEDYYYVGKLTLDNDNRFIDVLKQYLCGNEVYVFSKNTEDYNEYSTDFYFSFKREDDYPMFYINLRQTSFLQDYYKITLNYDESEVCLTELTTYDYDPKCVKGVYQLPTEVGELQVSGGGLGNGNAYATIEWLDDKWMYNEYGDNPTTSILGTKTMTCIRGEYRIFAIL